MNTLRWSLILAMPLASAACLADPDLGAGTAPTLIDDSIRADRPVAHSSSPDRAEQAPEEALAPGTERWIRRIGGTADERLGGLALGGNGEVLVTGSFHHWIDFGPRNLYAPAGDDVFTTAIDDGGASMWVQQLSGLQDERSMAIAGTPDGGFVVVGAFPGDINLGDGSRQSRGGLDGFIARYDRDGAHLWSTTLGGAGDDRAEAVGVDGRGNVIVAGSFEGVASIAGARIDSTGGRDLYAARFAATGEIEVRRFGGDGDDVLGGLSVNQEGAFALAATFRWSRAEIDGRDPMLGDAIVIAHDRAGSVRWVANIGGAGVDLAGGVIIDDNNSVAVAVSFSEEVVFAGQAYRSAGGSDAMMAVYDPRGGEHWATVVGGSGQDRATHLALDPTRGPVLLGSFHGSIGSQPDASGTRHPLQLESQGGADVFAIGYDFEGQVRWAISAGSADHDHSAGVVIDHDGNAVIAGSFTGELYTAGARLASSGGRDLFVLGIAQ